MTNKSLSCQFTVIGAGPYGMAVASHLRAAGAEVRIFGRPMEFWDRHMPKGMLLRSPWAGSNIGDPIHAFTLDRYELALGSKLDRRVPLEDFVRYGQWFQSKELPDLDERNITSVERDSAGYRITLSDGEEFTSHNVVVAVGIGSFANYPKPFACLPPELVSHTRDPINNDLGRFAGKTVAVVGAGQSAIESAALLGEAGAEVEVLVRRQHLRWLHSAPFLEWLMDCRINPFKAPGKIGPIGLNWLIEHPALFTAAPREFQDAMTRRAIRPAASSWLRSRTRHVTISAGRCTRDVKVLAGKVHIQLNDSTDRVVDHVLLGTGYKIDISQHDFLSAELRQGLNIVNGYPLLNRGFESSQRGLYFVGAAAAYSFGPLLRFVAGTRYAGAVLSRHAIRMSQSPIPRISLARPQTLSSDRAPESQL